VAREQRGHGLGRLAMQALLAEAEAAGFWKLVSRVFVENAASRALLGSLGFREVGIYEKHGQLDGVWRDVVIVERLIEANLAR
jgi:phosphinothricin acetyltransferase